MSPHYRLHARFCYLVGVMHTPSKLDTQCWFDVGPALKTEAQHIKPALSKCFKFAWLAYQIRDVFSRLSSPAPSILTYYSTLHVLNNQRLVLKGLKLQDLQMCCFKFNTKMIIFCPSNFLEILQAPFVQVDFREHDWRYDNADIFLYKP